MVSSSQPSSRRHRSASVAFLQSRPVTYPPSGPAIRRVVSWQGRLSSSGGTCTRPTSLRESGLMAAEACLFFAFDHTG